MFKLLAAVSAVVVLAGPAAAKGADPNRLFGHSLGGTASLYLAEKHGDHLKKVMMVDALPFFGGMQDPKATADSIRPMAAKMRDGMVANNAPLGVPAGMMEKVYPALYAPATTVKLTLVAGSQHFIMFDQPQPFAELFGSGEELGPALAP